MKLFVSPETVVQIKGVTRPTITLRANEQRYRVSYIQVAYDNRYVVIEHNDYGTHWRTIAQTSDRVVAAGFLESLVSRMTSAGQRRAEVQISEFWTRVEDYDGLR